jgi:hypothetical protein
MSPIKLLFYALLADKMSRLWKITDKGEEAAGVGTAHVELSP